MVEVTNELAVIDGVTAALDGGEGLTVTVEPPLLPLFPDGTGVLTLTLQPSPTLPGRLPPPGRRAALERRAPLERHRRADRPCDAGAPGHLTVVPPVRSARHRARYGVVLDSTGNTALDVALAASDADRALTPHFAPPGLLLGPGASATSVLTVNARRRLIGSELTRQLSVVGTTADLDRRRPRRCAIAR